MGNTQDRPGDRRSAARRLRNPLPPGRSGSTVRGIRQLVPSSGGHHGQRRPPPSRAQERDHHARRGRGRRAGRHCRARVRASRLDRRHRRRRRGGPTPPAPSTSTGYGGAVSSVDAEASAIGLEVLRDGGNAVDAAIATAAALGVTEPYSAGIGGGGYFVYFDAASGEVTTIDGRETAPAAMPSDAFVVPGSVSDTAPFGVGVRRSRMRSRPGSRSACRAPSPRGRPRSTGSAPSRCATS